eukprot:scaffold65057_cov50-Prasinocladus_malaysianus.AAC.1
MLPVFFPCSSLPDKTYKPNIEASIATEAMCAQSFASVSQFEQEHALSLQAMSAQYLDSRSELVALADALGSQLSLQTEAVHDAVLLMDRLASTGTSPGQGSMCLLMAACVKVCANASAIKGEPKVEDEALASASGMPVASLRAAELDLRMALRDDLAAISALRCLHIYLEKMGCDFSDPVMFEAMGALPTRLASESLGGSSFLNCRPSIVAAAILYTCRRSRGIVPYWPSSLCKLTRSGPVFYANYKDMSTPEMSVAIKAAQRLYVQAIGARPPPAISLGRSESEGSMYVPLQSLGGSPNWFSPTPLQGVSPTASFTGASHPPLLDVASAELALYQFRGSYAGSTQESNTSAAGSPPWESSPRSNSSFNDLNFAGLSLGM